MPGTVRRVSLRLLVLLLVAGILGGAVTYLADSLIPSPNRAAIPPITISAPQDDGGLDRVEPEEEEQQDGRGAAEARERATRKRRRASAPGAFAPAPTTPNDDSGAEEDGDRAQDDGREGTPDGDGD